MTPAERIAMRYLLNDVEQKVAKVMYDVRDGLPAGGLKQRHIDALRALNAAVAEMYAVAAEPLTAAEVANAKRVMSSGPLQGRVE